MRRLFALALLSCGPGWDSTPAASARRIGGAHVEACIKTHGCYFKQWCLEHVERGYCADAGFPGCSRNEPEGLCS